MYDYEDKENDNSSDRVDNNFSNPFTGGPAGGGMPGMAEFMQKMMSGAGAASMIGGGNNGIDMKELLKSLTDVGKRTMLMGVIDDARFTIEIKSEFSCKLAINILNEMMKKFRTSTTTEGDGSEEEPEPVRATTKSE